MSDEKPATTTTRGDMAKEEAVEIDPDTGMQRAYIILTEEERAKGFVRPVRYSYRHVGMRPTYQTRPLTEEEKERFLEKLIGYVAYEKYPEDSGISGRFWTQAQLDSGCGQVTTMGQALAETCARDPSFYGATFCATCREHYAVGPKGEFVWEGTSERVGT